MAHQIIRIFALLLALFSLNASAQEKLNYALAAGDSVRILVFQNPDLTIEARVSEGGSITFPLIGAVRIGGLSTQLAEQRIADALEKGGFVRKPQVNILLLQIRGNQVAVLGQVNKPGRFPLETTDMRLSDVLATAGGAIPGGGAVTGGDDVVIVSGVREGKSFRKEIDIPALYLGDKQEDNILMASGDTVYVPRAAVFYIYGEAQRPGAYRIERGMTIMQALAVGGGPTSRGTENKVRLHRRNADGSIRQITPDMTENVLSGDVIYVRESLF